MGSLLSKAREIRVAIDSINPDLEHALDFAVELIRRSLLEGGKILIFGNGGSAADSQHFAAELVSSLHGAPLPSPLRALALTTDTSILTAIGNDADFKQVFARQVQAFCDPGDVVIGLTTSGRSVNVVEGLRVANEMGAKTLAITGQRGLREKVAAFEIPLPSTKTQVVQTLTLLTLHSLCEDLEEMREWAQ